MTKELALQLKAAGYPQNRDFIQIGMDWVSAPSLESLIEELGDKFVHLKQQEAPKWWAMGRVTDELTTNAYGNTALEAVAELWISTRKKQSQ